MAPLVSSSRGIDPIEILLAVVQFVRRQALVRHATHFFVNRRDRPLYIGWIHAGAHEKRSLDDIRVERAEHVVRHALPLADAVAQPAADAVLAERIVHQRVRVVPRIASDDRGEAVRDVGLRLVHHRNDTLLARAISGRMRQHDFVGCGLRAIAPAHALPPRPRGHDRRRRR